MDLVCSPSCKYSKPSLFALFPSAHKVPVLVIQVFYTSQRGQELVGIFCERPFGTTRRHLHLFPALACWHPGPCVSTGSRAVPSNPGPLALFVFLVVITKSVSGHWEI